MSDIARTAARLFWNVGSFGSVISDIGAVVTLRPRPTSSPRLATRDGRLAPESDFEVEELSLEQLDAVQTEWSSLAARAIEPNVFCTPGFALSAARHFPMRNRPRFIAVWDMRVSPRQMAGLFPVVSSSGIFGDGLIRIWLHKQATLATPLVDAVSAEETLCAFINWIEVRSRATGIAFGQIRAGGRFHDALQAAAGDSGRSTRVLEQRQRAALFAGVPADVVIAAGSKERLSQLRRQRRRLEAMGHVTLQEDSLPQDVRRAAEEFLALEAAGWKSARGALLSQASLSTFFRSATRLLSREELCRIVSLRLDGRPLAMMVVLESQGHGFFWKTAFDEAFRALAPGVQLFYEQSRAQLARPDIVMTDSCAAPDHPLIDRLWSDRIEIADVAVQLQRGQHRDFESSCRSDKRRRTVRELAKRAAYRLLNRKRS